MYCSDANIQKNQHVNNGNLVLTKIYKLTHHFFGVAFLYNNINQIHFVEGALNAFITLVEMEAKAIINKIVYSFLNKLEIVFLCMYMCGDM